MQDYSMFFLLGLMIVMFWWMSRSSKKMRQKMMDERAAAVVLGNTVVTTAGFYGTIVDIDGDAVTLQSPAGDETVWLRSSIASVSDLPLGNADEDELIDSDVVVDESVEDESPEGDRKPGSAWA
ncbi:MAG: preprotein translocase subunit YajC [Ancrocorticia sp.]